QPGLMELGDGLIEPREVVPIVVMDQIAVEADGRRAGFEVLPGDEELHLVESPLADVGPRVARGEERPQAVTRSGAGRSGRGAEELQPLEPDPLALRVANGPGAGMEPAHDPRRLARPAPR